MAKIKYLETIDDRDAELIILLLGISKPTWENSCPSMAECSFTPDDVHDLLERLLAFRIRVRAIQKVI